MSAMPGLAMVSSAKGVPLSTTTARFMGTCSARWIVPPCTLRVCAVAKVPPAIETARPRRPALISVLTVIVTLPLDHGFTAGLLPASCPSVPAFVFSIKNQGFGAGFLCSEPATVASCCGFRGRGRPIWGCAVARAGPRSVGAGDLLLHHVGAAADLGGADLRSLGDLDLFFHDSQQPALIHLDHLGHGVVFGAHQR